MSALEAEGESICQFISLVNLNKLRNFSQSLCLHLEKEECAVLISEHFQKVHEAIVSNAWFAAEHAGSVR